MYRLLACCAFRQASSWAWSRVVGFVLREYDWYVLRKAGDISPAPLDMQSGVSCHMCQRRTARNDSSAVPFSVGVTKIDGCI